MYIKKIKIRDLMLTVKLEGLIFKQTYINSQKIAKKVIDIENYLKLFNIQIVVKNSILCLEELNNEQIIDILNKDQFYLLRAIYYQDEMTLQDETVYITLIEDMNYNVDNYYIFDYLVKLSNFIVEGKVDFSLFIDETKEIFEKEKTKSSTYVLGSKTSILETIYGPLKSKKKSIKS